MLAAVGSAAVSTFDAPNKTPRAEQPGPSDEGRIDTRSVWKNVSRPTQWHTNLSCQELIDGRDQWFERTVEGRNDMLELKKRKVKANHNY